MKTRRPDEAARDELRDTGFRLVTTDRTHRTVTEIWERGEDTAMLVTDRELAQHCRLYRIEWLACSCNPTVLSSEIQYLEERMETRPCRYEEEAGQ